MILVDTSVWVEFLSPRDTAVSQQLTAFIENGYPVCINGVVQMEIQMGLKTALQLTKIKDYLAPYQYYPDIDYSDLDFASEIYRSCRKRGKTVRKSTDCLIAAQCLRYELQLFHNDRDFQNIGSVYKDLVLI